jgi:hypothetical protein
LRRRAPQVRFFPHCIVVARWIGNEWEMWTVGSIAEALQIVQMLRRFE